MFAATGLKKPFRLGHLFLLLLVAVLALTIMPAASADQFTYLYTGAPFTTCYSFSSSPCSQYFISGKVTLDAPILANDSSTQALSPISFSFSDQDPTHPVLTDQQDIPEYFYVYNTDGNGLPLSWSFFLSDATNSCSSGFQISSYATAPFDCSGGAYGGWFGGSDAPGVWSIESTPSTTTSDPPDQTTTTDTPEPSSLAMLTLALLGMMLFGRARHDRRPVLTAWRK